MQKRDKWRLWAVLWVLLSVAVAGPAFSEETQPKDDRVAIVNGFNISREVFNREMDRVQRQIIASGKRLSLSEMPALQEQVLNGLINRELLYQECRKRGVQISDEEVSAQIQQFKSRYPDEKSFKEAMEKNRIDEETLTTDIRKGMIVGKFIDQEFGKKSKVPDEEAKAYYDKNPDLFTQPEQVRASHILVKVEQGAGEEVKAAARKKIEEAQNRVKKGEDFGTLAKELSDCPSGKNGGDLNYFRRGQMVKPFEDAAFALKQGEVSGIVETRFGYHIIKVTDKKKHSLIPFEDVKAKLIQVLTRQKLQREVHEFIERIKETSKIEKFLLSSDKSPADTPAPAAK